MRRSLVIMARRPTWGRVKTRLAAGIGRGPALAIYRRLLSRTLRRLGHDGRWATVLAATPAHEASRPGRWTRGLPVLAQAEGDLGQRLAAAIGAMPTGPVVVVGTDIPDLDRRHVAAAFRALEHHDAVFGPAEDGGYWLVGIAASLRGAALFEDVRWSSEHALGDTLAGLPRDATVALIDILADIDDIDDLRRWRVGRRTV